MDDADYRALPVLGRLKSLAHRRLTAYAPRADQCHACGLCVVACPERAISLVRDS
jgi:4Fe-4S ferredoxin